VPQPSSCHLIDLVSFFCWLPIHSQGLVTLESFASSAFGLMVGRGGVGGKGDIMHAWEQVAEEVMVNACLSVFMSHCLHHTSHMQPVWATVVDMRYHYLPGCLRVRSVHLPPPQRRPWPSGLLP
jgi:hypothetical protein